MRPIKPALTILIALAGITNFGGLVYHQLTGKNPEITAEARRSGGRSGGGSFGRSSGSSSRSRSTGSSGGGSFNRSSSPSYNNSPGNTLIYVPGGGYSSGSGYNSDAYLMPLFMALVLIFVAAGAFWLVYQMIRAGGKALQQVPGLGNELDNEQVSIHVLQVALYAQAREVQQRLNQISLELDTESPEDLYTLFQETALALLRTPENWAYVWANVQKSNRTNAPGLFNQLSVQERTKFSHESLVNMAGRIRKMSPSLPDPSAAPAAYIVVTMLIGTAHDRPLFEQVRTHEQLTETLNKLVNMPPDFLLTYEVLWTPQDEADSLSSDEMLTEYANMIQI
ncbi:MAG: DUF1517 domain-containing protein [Pseudanabaenaceae cyanobacterium bins.68]|nr:DUF1517 domain-containing protein [Pseudanabaenaceae cyanobacterium bins.68]